MPRWSIRGGAPLLAGRGLLLIHTSVTRSRGRVYPAFIRAHMPRIAAFEIDRHGRARARRRAVLTLRNWPDGRGEAVENAARDEAARAATVSSGRKAELRRSASRTEAAILARYPIDCFGRDLADCSPSALDWASQRSGRELCGRLPLPGGNRGEWWERTVKFVLCGFVDRVSWQATLA